MANKKDFTIEELKQQCEDAKKNCEALNEQLTKAIKEEEDRKKAQLALEKEQRRKELDAAFEYSQKLLKDFIRDYGSYHNTYTPDYWYRFFS